VHARGALGAWKSLPLQLATPNAASTASRIKALNIRALVATPTNDPIRLKRKELHLRSTCMFMARSGLAWTVNIAVLLGLCVLILIYAGLFGDKEVKTLIKTWALAIGMACGVIEPFNIFVVAALPLLVKSDGPCARCYTRVFACYNDLIA